MWLNTFQGNVLNARAKNLSKINHGYTSRSVNLTPDSYISTTIGKEIKRVYFENETFGENNKDRMCDFLSDFHFNIEHYMTAELIAKYQPR